jgi:hypothetical protein
VKVNCGKKKANGKVELFHTGRILDFSWVLPCKIKSILNAVKYSFRYLRIYTYGEPVLRFVELHSCFNFFFATKYFIKVRCITSFISTMFEDVNRMKKIDAV